MSIPDPTGNDINDDGVGGVGGGGVGGGGGGGGDGGGGGGGGGGLFAFKRCDCLLLSICKSCVYKCAVYKRVLIHWLRGYNVVFLMIAFYSFVLLSFLEIVCSKT